jgi:hypothetical protein
MCWEELSVDEQGKPHEVAVCEPPERGGMLSRRRVANITILICAMSAEAVGAIR